MSLKAFKDFLIKPFFNVLFVLPCFLLIKVNNLFFELSGPRERGFLELPIIASGTSVHAVEEMELKGSSAF